MAESDRSGEGSRTAGSDKSARVMKAVVIGLGVLLVAGFAVVFSTIIYRTVKLADDRSSPERSGSATEVKLTVPEGARIGSMVLDGNRLAVQMISKDGEEIVIIDVRRGDAITRIRLVPGSEKGTSQ